MSCTCVPDNVVLYSECLCHSLGEATGPQGHVIIGMIRLREHSVLMLFKGCPGRGAMVEGCCHQVMAEACGSACAYILWIVYV